MSNPPILSETRAAILRAAAEHPDHVAVPPKRLPAAARNAVIASLLRVGLLEEVAPVGEGGLPMLRITPAGLATIEQKPGDTADEYDISVGEESGTRQPVRLTLTAGAASTCLAGLANLPDEDVAFSLGDRAGLWDRRRAGRHACGGTGGVGPLISDFGKAEAGAACPASPAPRGFPTLQRGGLPPPRLVRRRLEERLDRSER